jgi:hypothetical protein
MSAAPPEPRKEPDVESSNNGVNGHVNGSESRLSDVSDDPASERAQRMRQLEARLKECERRTLEDIAETTSVTLRLKEKLDSTGDTGRIKIRKTRLDVPVPPEPTPSQSRPAGQKKAK